MKQLRGDEEKEKRKVNETVGMHGYVKGEMNR